MDARPIRARRLALPAALIACLAVAPAARADWMQPDASWREAQMELRAALRDTAGRGDHVPSLDTLGVALLRVGRVTEAEVLFRRVLAFAPNDAAALAGLGKLALFANRGAQAESLLAAGRNAEGATADLYFAKLRRGDWAGARTLCEDAGDTGMGALAEALANAGAEGGPAQAAFTLAPGPERAIVPFQRQWPVPLVRVKLNGRDVVMAVDVGLADCLIDGATARLLKLPTLPSQRNVFWNGGHVAATTAVLRDLEIGGMKLATVPAGVTSLRKYSLAVNPQAPQLGGVIGVNVLRRFGVVMDMKKGQLELSRPGVALATPSTAARVPFEWWGEAELMVTGTLNGGRKMKLMLGTGLPGGVGATQAVLDEVGVKPGSISRAVRNAGAVLQGHAWAQTTVNAAMVGTVACDKLTAWSGAFDAYEMWRHGMRRDALLGPEVWEKRRVTFDWEKSELRVEGD